LTARYHRESPFGPYNGTYQAPSRFSVANNNQKKRVRGGGRSLAISNFTIDAAPDRQPHQAIICA
ncbi:MAG: hypothetical protein WCG00_14680, partial [Hyphomicrobiales bacterium]